ncbi:hypothetical protein GCM10018980_61120 [Streptomyces capoamus]|uniref:Uncharacterized protein n=1 Tax=Streptomyces capoamus TaxID=68183 RepID=A0A919F195_9ACTN|nr:hypothetical protein GCM10010501_47000 [Streptomyces libani subsp. rufus]GHG67905.1 hypothetical protein GCM10018980_61120 [Streptomyces capoamus]
MERGDPGQREVVARLRAAGPEEHDGLRHGAWTFLGERADNGHPGCRSPIGGTRGGSDLALRAAILTHSALNCQR